MKLTQIFFSLVGLLLLGACASTSEHQLKPAVELVGIEQSASAESALEFDIQLRITNPNEAPLELTGLYYELRLEGIDVVSGTARDIPTIEGFSSETIRVKSGANIINGARLVAYLMNDPDNMIAYKLRVKLGSKSRWNSGDLIEKEGEIPLN